MTAGRRGSDARGVQRWTGVVGVLCRVVPDGEPERGGRTSARVTSEDATRGRCLFGSVGDRSRRGEAMFSGGWGRFGQWRGSRVGSYAGAVDTIPYPSANENTFIKNDAPKSNVD